MFLESNTINVLSCVQLSVASWTVACKAPLSMEFSRKIYWSGLPFLLQEIFLTQGSNPLLMSPELAGRSFQNWCITKFCVSKRTPLKDPLCLLSWKIKEHILEEIPPIGQKKKKKKATRKCSVCSSREKHSETLCFCNRCCDPLNRGIRHTACHALMKY